jgi:hypothetical protein
MSRIADQHLWNTFQETMAASRADAILVSLADLPLGADRWGLLHFGHNFTATLQHLYSVFMTLTVPPYTLLGVGPGTDPPHDGGEQKNHRLTCASRLDDTGGQVTCLAPLEG